MQLHVDELKKQASARNTELSSALAKLKAVEKTKTMTQPQERKLFARLEQQQAELKLAKEHRMAAEKNAAELAARLAFQLQRLEAMRNASEQLMQLPQLGQEFFARGEPDQVVTDTTTVFSATLFDLLSVYGMIKQRGESSVLHIAPMNLYSMDDALVRLSTLIGKVPDWTVLSSFLPDATEDELVTRSAVASTFAASLELTKQGKVQLSQSGSFEPIFLRTRKEESENG